VSDFNEPRLPSQTYDIVFFHQSAHHVSKLEKLYSEILRSLKRNGLVYLDEYIGPSRFDWNDELIAPHRRFYARISPDARLQDPLSLPIHPIDPSEAIRSSEIISQLEHGFRILEQRNYGGSLLSVPFSAVDWTKEPSIGVTDLIAAEKEMLREGMPSYHAIIVAGPKRGIFRWHAMLRYFIAPKLRRVRWEVAKRVWPDRDIKF
jgi:SAM-dependent methyltransferase